MACHIYKHNGCVELNFPDFNLITSKLHKYVSNGLFPSTNIPWTKLFVDNMWQIPVCYYSDILSFMILEMYLGENIQAIMKLYPRIFSR